MDRDAYRKRQAAIFGTLLDCKIYDIIFGPPPDQPPRPEPLGACGKSFGPPGSMGDGSCNEYRLCEACSARIPAAKLAEWHRMDRARRDYDMARVERILARRQDP